MIYFWIGFILFIVLSGAALLLPIMRFDQLSWFKRIFLYVMVIVMLLILISALYWHYGNGQQVASYYQRQQQLPLVAQLKQELKTPEQVIERLKQSIKQNPDKAKGYYLLGRLYYVNEQYQEAMQAFKHGMQMQPENKDMVAYYVTSSYFAHDKKITAEDEEILNTLKDDIDNVPTLKNLFAVNAYQKQHYQQAITWWRELLTQEAEDSPNREALQQAISLAQREFHK